MKTTLPAVLRSASVLSLIAAAALLTGCNRNQTQTVALVLPDLHTATYVGDQFGSMPAMPAHYHPRTRLARTSVTISRHAPH